MMKTLAPLALAALVAGAADAACIAEYKAKRDDPLKLFYGTTRISGACTTAAAETQLRGQLGAQGLTLLKVLSVTEE